MRHGHGLADEARQKLIDEQRKIVQGVVNASDYKKFEGKEIEYHSVELRKYTGHLLDEDANRDPRTQPILYASCDPLGLQI
jgi:hypothetical protein